MMGISRANAAIALDVAATVMCWMLPLLFVASAVLNVRQWADHRAYVQGEQARLEAAANKAGLQVAAKIAGEKQRDTKALLAELDAIAERGQRTRTVYKVAAAKAPLAEVCAPGAERMSAVNAGADK